MTIIDGHVFLGKTIYMKQTCETLIANMDRLGVDISVVVAPPPGPFYGEANAYVIEAVKKHPGRLTALFRANPQLEGEDERFRDALGRNRRGRAQPVRPQFGTLHALRARSRQLSSVLEGQPCSGPPSRRVR